MLFVKVFCTSSIWFVRACFYRCHHSSFPPCECSQWRKYVGQNIFRGVPHYTERIIHYVYVCLFIVSLTYPSFLYLYIWIKQFLCWALSLTFALRKYILCNFLSVDGVRVGTLFACYVRMRVHVYSDEGLCVGISNIGNYRRDKANHII